MIRLLLAILALNLSVVGAAFGADAAAGAVVFKKCMACHAVGPNAPNKVGPEPNGLLGRTAGSVAGYSYSQANRKSGIVWSEDMLTKYLRDPRGVVPGTKMMFAGLKNDDDAANVIAYLKQFGPDGKQNP